MLQAPVGGAYTMDKDVNTKKNGNQAMIKICGFIVDKRNLFFLIFGLLIIFSAISRNWVGVENSMSYYSSPVRLIPPAYSPDWLSDNNHNLQIALLPYRAQQGKHRPSHHNQK